jgi:hypothetical protein
MAGQAGEEEPMAAPENTTVRTLANPIVLIALIIVSSVIALIAAAVLGFDKGVVLASMGRSEFARGLITYLFAIVTIGTAVVLVLSALLGAGDDLSEKRFQRGKEILALLLGVFGTMVGFYFGAETSSGTRAESGILRLSSLDVSPRVVSVGGKVTVRAVASGGTPPYRFAVALGAEEPDPQERAPEGGWIIKDVSATKARPGEFLNVHVVVIDSTGRKTEQSTLIQVQP